MTSKKICDSPIWILGDSRAGTISQAVGLAQEIKKLINLDYRIINFEYSSFGRVPNIFSFTPKLRVSSYDRNLLFPNEIEKYPSIIISSGRKAALVSCAIKKFFNDEYNVKVRNIHIMNPEIEFDKFDLVVVPSHDNLTSRAMKSKNLIITTGSMNKINLEAIKIESTKFAALDPSLFNGNKNIIALIIGGSSKNTDFDVDSASNLINHMELVAKEMGHDLYVLNSPRTCVEINELLKSRSCGVFTFFDWNKIKNNNPYLAILNYARFFVVSGDSVSMISECCSTEKPVFIFDEKNISSKKHRRFHSDLYKGGYAKPLMFTKSTLENYLYRGLAESRRVASIVVDKFFV